MGIKKKAEQIAKDAAAEAIKTIGPTLSRQNVETNTPFTTTVVRATGPNEFIVKDPFGNEKTVTYLGDRPIGPSGTVLITGDFAR